MGFRRVATIEKAGRVPAGSLESRTQSRSFKELEIPHAVPAILESLAFGPTEPAIEATGANIGLQHGKRRLADACRFHNHVRMPDRE